MNIQEAFKKLEKLMQEGHGNATLVHTDTRSGVTERAHIGSVDTVNGNERDFYTDLDTGDEYLEIYEGD